MLSEFRKKKFVSWFHHLDIDKDDLITAGDFHRYEVILREEMGWETGEHDGLIRLRQATDMLWRDLRSQVKDHNETITLSQWVTFLYSASVEIAETGSPPKWAVELCNTLHRVLDLTGDGTVTSKEYALWLKAVGSTADPDEVFLRIDLNGDGIVRRNEMLLLFGQFLLSEDPWDPGNYIMTGTI